MGFIQSTIEEKLSVGPGTEPDFLFSSHGSVMRAYGVGRQLDIALTDAAFVDGRWDAEVRRTFRELERQGVENPVLVGAVPFDLDRPACLFVPDRWETTGVSKALAEAVPAFAPPVAAVTAPLDRARYEAAVERALELFRSTDLRKVVLSRPLDIDAVERFEPHHLVGALLSQNPGAYVFSVPVADDRTLVGASPELLVAKFGRDVVSNPLAGSARRRHDESAGIQRDRLAGLLRSEKDRVEHRYVVEAVRDALAPHCATLAVPEGPSVIATPTMWHLSSRIEGQLSDPSVSPLRLAAALHPTPAVCGTPTSDAFAAIERLEGYARGWYSGMVGWMDARGNGEWAVTIRCGLVGGTRLRLYAGAGIVAESSPAAEWEETAAKLATMLNAFGLETAVAPGGEGGA